MFTIMSKSKRKPFIKDKPRDKKKKNWYWKKIRRVINNLIKGQVYEVPKPREIINDYDYCDYVFESENVKFTRK